MLYGLGSKIGKGSGVPQLGKKLAGRSLEQLRTFGSHLRPPIAQTGSNWLPFTSLRRHTFLRLLVKPKNHFVKGQTKKGTDFCAFLRRISDQGLVAQLVIQLGAEPL